MIRVKELNSQETVEGLRAEYIKLATAPLDGMWLCGFVPMASHFGCYDGDELVGYYCVNDEGYLLQFFMNENCRSQSSEVFSSIVSGDNVPTGKVVGAFASTAEPYYLSLCLDLFSRFDVNALMYQLGGNKVKKPKADVLPIKAVELSQLEEVVNFASANIGASKEWLTHYFSNLINREELMGVWETNSLVATGERREYDSHQTDYADLGVIVAKSKRGRGIATSVLTHLVEMNETKRLQSICSTEKTNFAAQRAITRAGFFASNRIIQFHV